MSITKYGLFAMAAAASIAAGAVHAQSAFTGTNAAEDRNDDLRDDIQDDFERDLDRFGNEGRKLGFDGSIALRGTATSGNTDSADLGFGANLGYFDGVNGYEATFNYTYSDDNGSKTEENLFYDLQYTRDFNPRFYGFAKVQGSLDEFSSYETDTFVGFGVGYRIYDTRDMQWTIQAGPGYRVADITNPLGTDIDEAALSVSSNYMQRLNDTAFITNDTDVVASDSDTVVLNELGLNVAMTNTLALRTSVQTEYHTDPAPGFDDTDNTLGVSLVYTFN